jgi:hypothetical protein
MVFNEQLSYVSHRLAVESNLRMPTASLPEATSPPRSMRQCFMLNPRLLGKFDEGLLGKGFVFDC